MIHHLFFPHIIDLIFEHAPCESLIVMGQVCCEWRKRVEAKIDHLHVDLRQSSYSFPSSVPFYDAVRSCRVLDITLRYPTRHWASSVEHLKKLTRRLDTVRLKEIQSVNYPRYILRARRIVFSALHPCFSFHDSDGSGIKAGGWITAEKLVINYRPRKGKKYDYCCRPEKQDATLFPQLKQLIVILHGDWACSHCLVHIFDEAFDMSVPVTVVGAETTKGRDAFQPYFVEGSVLVKVEHSRKYTRQGVKVVSHAEYRQAIGEKEYAIETSWEQPAQFQTFMLPDEFTPPKQTPSL